MVVAYVIGLLLRKALSHVKETLHFFKKKTKVVHQSIIENLMQQTFAFRRRKIEVPANINVIKRYPSLSRPQQVNHCAHVCTIQLHH